MTAGRDETLHYSALCLCNLPAARDVAPGKPHQAQPFHDGRRGYGYVRHQGNVDKVFDRYWIGINGPRPRSPSIGDLGRRNGVRNRDGAGVPSVLVGDARLWHRVGDGDRSRIDLVRRDPPPGRENEAIVDGQSVEQVRDCLR